MKTKEELNTLKEEVEAPNAKLNALTKEELAQVTGGGICTGPCSECPVKDCPKRSPSPQKFHIK